MTAADEAARRLAINAVAGQYAASEVYVTSYVASAATACCIAETAPIEIPLGRNLDSSTAGVTRNRDLGRTTASPCRSRLRLPAQGSAPNDADGLQGRAKGAAQRPRCSSRTAEYQLTARHSSERARYSR